MAKSLGVDPYHEDLTLGDLDWLVNQAKKFGTPSHAPARMVQANGANLLVVGVAATVKMFPAAKAPARKPQARARRGRAAPES
jgi:hypothetical protein